MKLYKYKCNILKIAFVFILLFILSFNIYSVNKIDDLSFTDTEITEVLKAVSEIFEITIVPDRDVQGRITRYFKDTTLEQTLVLLLEPLGFAYEVNEGVYFVKKKPLFSVEYNEPKKSFTINSNRAKLEDVINNMSIKSKETIVFSGSPNDVVNIHIFDKDILESLKLLTESLNYEITKEGTSYYAKKQESEAEFLDTSKSGGRILIKGDENNIELKLANQASNDLIIALFKKFDKKLSLLSNKSVRIPYLDVTNVTFDDLLKIIFQHSDQTSTKLNDVYYIYDALSGRDSVSQRITAIYRLKNLDYKSFTINIPTQIVPQTAYKLDAENNQVTVFGSEDEVDLYMSFIKKIDEGMGDFEHRFFKLKSLDVKKIRNYLPEKYQRLKLTVIDDQNMLSAYLSNEDYKELKNYIDQIDVSFKKEYKYRFKYLNPEDVQKSMLPKSITADQVVLNKNDSSLIFTITEDAKESLFNYFDSIDLPHPVIRYQILIVEYSQNSGFKYNFGLGFKKGGIESMFDFGNWGFSGGIESGNIGATFDIPTVFGNYFSASLALQLTQNKAKIKMSSEVYGLSGETVTLSNTRTDRLRDEIKNAEDNKELRPVYTSITYGLNIDVKGRSTSSDEVYIEVSAKHSDATEGDGSGGPSTSEKAVKNFIRTKTGKPIALGGLTSNITKEAHTKIPGLGDIPFIGNLFKTHNNQYSDSEFVIYIIPFIQKSEEDLQRERRVYIKKIYEYFVER